MVFVWYLLNVSIITYVRNTEKSSPPEIYFTLILRIDFSCVGNDTLVWLFNPNCPKSFFPQPKTAPNYENKIF